jgi:hypothetical protein
MLVARAMNRFFFHLMLSAAVAGWALAEAGDPADLPEADVLLNEVIARMPREPVSVAGTLQTAPAGTNGTRTLNVELYLHYGTNPAVARYTIRDAFGAALEEMTLTREHGKSLAFAYRRGSPLEPTEVPPLTQPIQGTDIAWLDLSLSFLWWRGGKTVGHDMVRGQACYVVDIPAPSDGSMAYGRVRTWIDEKFRFMLQAEAYDTEDRLVRRLSVKSFKKINDRWILKDMDVTTYPARTKTTLRIADVRIRG